MCRRFAGGDLYAKNSTITKQPGDISPWIYKEDFRDDLIHLEPYAVEIRYPGENATVEESKTAVRYMRRVRRALRSKLGIVD
jgi:hypothetical protein